MHYAGWAGPASCNAVKLLFDKVLELSGADLVLCDALERDVPFVKVLALCLQRFNAHILDILLSSVHRCNIVKETSRVVEFDQLQGLDEYLCTRLPERLTWNAASFFTNFWYKQYTCHDVPCNYPPKHQSTKAPNTVWWCNLRLRIYDSVLPPCRVVQGRGHV